MNSDGQNEIGFGIVNSLSQYGLHNLRDEQWNVYGQFTYIYFWKPSFQAAYTNLNGSNSSLVGNAEESFAQTFTLFFGYKLWNGGEVYFVPEAVAEQTLSNLKGLGGAIEDFELQKDGSVNPTIYRSRFFLQQTFGLGGERIDVPSGQMQLAKKVDSRRFVVSLGNYSYLDIFDKNSVIGDLRRSFFDEAFMTYAAWDYPSDARGYTIGLALEFYYDAWIVRLARLLPPQNPNQQSLDFRFWNFYGDTLELEHDHHIGGQPGAARLLIYRNSIFNGRFDDAINAYATDPSKNASNCGTLYNYGSTNTNAPDLCWVRATHVKVGIGLNLEQNFNSDIGVFLRGMISDGMSEVDAYNAADRSLNFGFLLKGTSWHREMDLIGVGAGASWISDTHAQYLSMGGVDAFIGDGRLRQAAESLFEFFYSYNLLKALWLSGDFQYISNPGYNADRGPVNLYGGRLHAEF